MAFHANYSSNNIIIPGNGTVLVSTANAGDPAEIKKFSLSDANTIPKGFQAIGYTSKENLPAFEKEGGETTVLDAWETASVDSFTTDVKRSLTFNMMAWSKEVLQLAYGSGAGTWDDTLKMQWADSHVNLTEKSLIIVFAGGAKRAGIFIPRCNLSLGDELSLNAEGAVETQLKATILEPTAAQSAKGQKQIGFFSARPYDTTGA